MLDFFYSIDLSIFYFFNHTLSSRALDKFFSIITNVNNWHIAYLILLGILFTKGGKKGKWAALGIILLVVVSDQFGNFLKEMFGRLRPCNELPDVITPLNCTGSKSFPSNHALNNFAAATYFYKLYPNYKIVLFTVAALVSISRVYLGLHYPADIIGGGIIGAALGFLAAKIFLHYSSEK